MTAAVSRGLGALVQLLTEYSGTVDGSMWSTASTVKLSLDERPVNSSVHV